MSAVTPAVFETLLQLQRVSSLAQFSLGGWTNLALRYNHRKSDDIDLFYSEIIGKSGYQVIEKEIKNLFGIRARQFSDPCAINDQFCFLRFFVDSVQGEVIKVELLQNMKCLDKTELYNDIRLLSKNDIGLFKLTSLSNRAAKKDIYDLDFITDEIPLIQLFEQFKIKTGKFQGVENRTIFDLHRNPSVVDFPELLLKFDNPTFSRYLPMHSHDNITIVPGNKSWIESKISWKMKVRELFNYLGKDFPNPTGKKIV